MSGPTAWYFAYASNMNRAQMLSLAGEIFEEQPAKLENYELLFNKKVGEGSAKANIRPAPGQTVEGVLYKIPEAAFRNLDRFAGVPEHYRRIEVKVTGGSASKVAAQVYMASRGDSGLQPAPHYLKVILEGAKEHGLSSEYIEKIKAIAQAV